MTTNSVLNTPATAPERPGTSARAHIPLWVRVTRVYIVAALPFLFVLIAVRLVMTPQFVQFEYNRPGFPGDPFGFTREDRLNYAPYAVNYLLNAEGVEYLGNLNFPDGRPLYNTRELRHMRDVKNVTTAAFITAVFVGGMAIISSVALVRGGYRSQLRRSLQSGAILSVSIIVAIVVLALAAWDTFFTGFHTLFFEGGSWYFDYSDTLIRLFPEQFWFDAAVAIGLLVIAFAAGTWGLTRVSGLWKERGIQRRRGETSFA